MSYDRDQNCSETSNHKTCITSRRSANHPNPSSPSLAQITELNCIILCNIALTTKAEWNSLLLVLLHFSSVRRVCLQARVVWRRKSHTSRKNISLSTLLSGFPGACADLTTSMGAAILDGSLGQASRETSMRLYLRYRKKMNAQVIYLREVKLGSFQCWGVLLLWHMVGQGPAALAAGAGRVGCFFFFFFFFVFFVVFFFFLLLLLLLLLFFITSILSSFSKASSLRRRLDILKYCGLGRYNPTAVVSYYRWRAC